MAHNKEYRRDLEFDFIENCIIKAYLISENWVGIDCDAMIELEKYDKDCNIRLSVAQHKKLANKDITGQITRKVIEKATSRTPKKSEKNPKNLILNYFQHTPENCVTFDSKLNKFVSFDENSSTLNLNSNLPTQTTEPDNQNLMELPQMSNLKQDKQENQSFENDLNLNNDIFTNIDPDQLTPEKSNLENKPPKTPEVLKNIDPLRKILTPINPNIQRNKFNFTHNLPLTFEVVGSLRKETSTPKSQTIFTAANFQKASTSNSNCKTVRFDDVVQNISHSDFGSPNGSKIFDYSMVYSPKFESNSQEQPTSPKILTKDDVKNAGDPNKETSDAYPGLNLNLTCQENIPAYLEQNNVITNSQIEEPKVPIPDKFLIPLNSTQNDPKSTLKSSICNLKNHLNEKPENGSQINPVKLNQINKNSNLDTLEPQKIQFISQNVRKPQNFPLYASEKDKVFQKGPDNTYNFGALTKKLDFAAIKAKQTVICAPRRKIETFIPNRSQNYEDIAPRPNVPQKQTISSTTQSQCTLPKPQSSFLFSNQPISVTSSQRVQSSAKSLNSSNLERATNTTQKDNGIYPTYTDNTVLNKMNLFALSQRDQRQSQKRAIGEENKIILSKNSRKISPVSKKELKDILETASQRQRKLIVSSDKVTTLSDHFDNDSVNNDVENDSLHLENITCEPDFMMDDFTFGDDAKMEVFDDSTRDAFQNCHANINFQNNFFTHNTTNNVFGDFQNNNFNNFKPNIDCDNSYFFTGPYFDDNVDCGCASRNEKNIPENVAFQQEALEKYTYFNNPSQMELPKETPAKKQKLSSTLDVLKIFEFKKKKVMPPQAENKVYSQAPRSVNNNKGYMVKEILTPQICSQPIKQNFYDMYGSQPNYFMNKPNHSKMWSNPLTEKYTSSNYPNIPTEDQHQKENAIQNYWWLSQTNYNKNYDPGCFLQNNTSNQNLDFSYLNNQNIATAHNQNMSLQFNPNVTPSFPNYNIDPRFYGASSQNFGLNPNNFKQNPDYGYDPNINDFKTPFNLYENNFDIQSWTTQSQDRSNFNRNQLYQPLSIQNLLHHGFQTGPPYSNYYDPNQQYQTWSNPNLGSPSDFQTRGQNVLRNIQNFDSWSQSNNISNNLGSYPPESRGGVNVSGVCVPSVSKNEKPIFDENEIINKLKKINEAKSKTQKNRDDLDLQENSNKKTRENDDFTKYLKENLFVSPDKYDKKYIDFDIGENELLLSFYCDSD